MTLHPVSARRKIFQSLAAPEASGKFFGVTVSKDLIATSIMESSGSRVVRYCNQSPGSVAGLTNEFWERAEKNFSVTRRA